MKARKLPAVNYNRVCDYCQRQILAGKEATQIVEGEAQGMYHGAACYTAALNHYRELKPQIEHE